MTSSKVAEMKSGPKWSAMLLTWGSLALAAAESLCVAAVGLSGVRVLVGLSSLIAATAGARPKAFIGADCVYRSSQSEPLVRC